MVKVNSLELIVESSRWIWCYSKLTIKKKKLNLDHLKILWLGNSKKNILTFPEDVKKLLGDELQLIQFGGMPKNAKPLKGIGSGVIEIAIK